MHARLTRYVVLLWLSLLASVPAAAGGFSILPTRLQLGSERSVQSVVLTNSGAQTVVIESQVRVWPEGADGQLANDLVVSPAVVTLPPGERMRVRVGLLRPGATASERAYRLYFTELPSPSPLQGAGIGVRLRIGIPVFVAPQQPRPQALHWQLDSDADGDFLRVRNDGNLHWRVAEPALLLDGDKPLPLAMAAPYVLAGTVLRVPLPAGLRLAAGQRVRWMDGDDVRGALVVAR
ncbi:MAG: fimbria/pilus periplasmic chaperone [Rubrivivax sp.]